MIAGDYFWVVMLSQVEVQCNWCQVQVQCMLGYILNVCYFMYWYEID